MAQAGELPHETENGSAVISIDAKSLATTEVGSGAPLLVDIEVGLNLPTSLEFIGNSAYIVNLIGEIWVIDDVSDLPFGKSR